MAGSGVNAATILDLITARQAAATAARDQLRQQMATLAGDLAAIERELSELATTRQTLITLTQNEVRSADPSIISEPYQQILAAFTPDGPGLRAKDVCRALGIGTEPKDTEGIRAKLKRLVNRQILTEAEPGLFALTRKRT
jgi:hypothetical protein